MNEREAPRSNTKVHGGRSDKKRLGTAVMSRRIGNISPLISHQDERRVHVQDAHEQLKRYRFPAREPKQ